MCVAGKIFVNYRRDDAKAEAARLHDRLAQSFGAANVFMDVDNLLPGERFDLRLKEALAGTDVFLAVIGARWLDLLEARAESGERDYVREEIATALAAKLVVIPVLMDRAPLPKAASLPEDIRELALYHKHDLVHESFGRDAQALIAAIEAHRQEKEKAEIEAERRARQKAKKNAAIVALAVLTIIISAYFLAPSKTPQPGSLDAHITVPIKPVEEVCDGIPAVAVSGAKICIRPGSGQGFKDCSDCPEMVVAPAGSITMGSSDTEIAALVKEYGTNWEQYLKWESPQHKVTISKPFAVGRYDVTFDEWAACVAGGGCRGTPSPEDSGWGKGKRPVIHVSWDHAQDYAKWLSRKTGKKYRLLTEAEWEYAARAGTQTRYYWGSDTSKNRANCNGCGSEWDGKQTSEVGKFAPNAFGLFDMSGNVWQWTEDCWNESYHNGPYDEKALTTGDCAVRVLRGGSWYSFPGTARAAARFREGTGNGLNDEGFRVARTLTP